LVTIPNGIGMVYTVGPDIFWAQRSSRAAPTCLEQRGPVPGGNEDKDPMSSHFSAVTDDSGNVFVTFTDAGNLYYNRRDAATSQWLTTPVTLVSADSRPTPCHLCPGSWLGGNQLLIAHNAGVQMRVLKGTTSTTSKSGFLSAAGVPQQPRPRRLLPGRAAGDAGAAGLGGAIAATVPGLRARQRRANAAAVRGRGDVLAQRGGQLPMSLGSCKPAGDNRSS
jgi:hypothetical protein